mmetsp:Transcript_71399/g.222710  ORF Transcript_71399/g.222710 Transcript_71399/m.222710 type:complete len:466 (+) Transcript_71399:1-1398(+)
MPPDDSDAPVRLFRCIAFLEGQPEATTEVPLQVVVVDGSVVMAAAGSLPGNCEYQFAVQAYNDGGWGPVGASSPPIYVWRPAAPGRPSATPMAAGSGLSLAWEASLDQTGQVMMEYYVNVRSVPSAQTEPSESAPAAEEVSRQLVRAAVVKAAGEAEEGLPRGSTVSVSAEVAGLRRGRSYTFRVQAAEGNEPRPVSEESEPLELQAGSPSPPGKPVGTLLEAPAGGRGVQSVRVEWTASESDGGFAIYGYRVHCHCLSKAALEMFGGDALADMPLQAPWVESSKARGVASLQGGAQSNVLQAVCSVGPGAPYCFEVQAINSQGASAPSPRSDVVHTPSAPPSACRGLVARRAGPGEVCLCWQPPAESGGVPVTSYLVASTPRAAPPGEGGPGENGEPEASCVTIGVEGQNSHWVRHSISRLQPGVEYAFSVCAVNSCGRGEEVQAPWTVTMPEEASSPPVGGLA